MNVIDLTLLYSGSTDEISLDGKYNIPKEVYENSSILELSEIDVSNGSIKRIEDDFYIEMSIKGEMKIQDSIQVKEI